MQSDKLSELSKKYPSEKNSIHIIEGLIQLNRGTNVEYELSTLIKMCRPNSMFSFQALLSELVSYGILIREYHLLGIKNEVIGKYLSLLGVPETIESENGIEEVDPNNLIEIYKHE